MIGKAGSRNFIRLTTTTLNIAAFTGKLSDFCRLHVKLRKRSKEKEAKKKKKRKRSKRSGYLAIISTIIFAIISFTYTSLFSDARGEI